MKKTLLSAALMMVFSVTMLLGTTYAWWSETIVVDENILQMGDLDLKVELADPAEDVNGVRTWYNLGDEYTTTGIFETTKTLEPGSTDTRVVRVTNDGSIPLAFNVFVDVDETNQLIPYVDFTVTGAGLNYTHTIYDISSGWIVLQPGEVIDFNVTYNVKTTLGDTDNGFFGEGLDLPFTVTFKAEQLAAVDLQ
jgi:hypothetical protein